MSDKKKFDWKPVEQEKINWLYSDDKEDAKRGCIGHLRGDFGSGKEFWTSWFPHNDELNQKPFRNELDDVVNAMRVKDGLLRDLTSMSHECYEQKGTVLDSSYRSFGFQLETKNFEYYLRCTPSRGDYNFYLYCWDKNAQREYAQPSAEKQKSLIETLHETNYKTGSKPPTKKKDEMEM